MPVRHAAAVIVAVLAACVAAHDDQKYNLNERIPLFVDTVVPENNPSETYRYFAMPFCKPQELHYKSQTLGEVLGGSRKIYSTYNLPFAQDVQHEELCTKTLEEADIRTLTAAIEQRYHFTMWYDEIPLRGYIGEVGKAGDVKLYTSLLFTMSWNRDRVIEAHVAPDPQSRVSLSADKKQEVTFSYSVKWVETEVEFQDRTANNAAELHEEDLEVQWFSIVNSCFLVVLLTGFLVYIMLRVLKKDYARYETVKDDDDDETGWKRLHADVFRFPKYRALFCAVLGCGVQIMLVTVCMLTLAVVGVFYPYGRGTAYAAIIVIYSLTAVMSGYTSGAMYRRLEGSVWVHNVLITVTLFVGPVFGVWAVLNTIATAYDSTAALPFGTIVALFALYILVAFPLTLAGAIFGKNFAGEFDAPTRTKFAAREIPAAPWYRSTPAHLFIAGFLPFSATFVELYYVFMSMWGHQLFTPFGILYLVFVMLLVVTACITVGLTYLQLATEDHQWWWMSLLSGGSTGAFLFLYCFYFLVTESKMTGLLQLSFYFGYMGLFSYAVFLMLSTVGFFASLAFVREIYKSVKSD